MPLGSSGSSAKEKVSVEPAYQMPSVDLGVEVVVAEQHEVGLEQAGVDLDLVDVGVAGLDLGHPGVGEQQVGPVEAAGCGRPRSSASSVASTVSIWGTAWTTRPGSSNRS